MDSLKIKAEQIEFVTNVFHSLSDNRMNDENQGYENESSDVIIEQLDLVGNGLAGINENGDIHENQENGDISSEPTLISVSGVLLINLSHVSCIAIGLHFELSYVKCLPTRSTLY